MKNTRENQCIETIKDALNSYIQNGDSVRFHNFVRRITRYELVGKPAIDAGTDAREYSSMKLYFGTKSGFEVVIDTYFGTVSAGDDRVWLADAVVDELNKIGELFYSYSDDEVKEDAYSEDRSIEPEDDNYWDKDRSEYVNRFTEDVEHNWDARYNHYTPIFKRSFRDDEPEFSGTFYNSQYNELVVRNKARFAATSKDKKFPLNAPSFQTSEEVRDRLRELNMNRQKTSFTYGFEKFAV